MVKGVSRQVVLVRPNESDVFEQAIFLVRGDRLSSSEITDEMLLRQAELAAADCVGAQNRPQKASLLPGMALGGAIVGLLWLLISIL